LAPGNAKVWAPKVKRIIFDEVHSIGQATDGLVWEQLLLLAPCPIIALSATVGNPEEFRDWLQQAQSAQNIKLSMIEHKHRYSDLRKFVFIPPKSYSFKGLDKGQTFDNIEHDLCFSNVHPISSLENIKKREFPPDLSLESRDCSKLYTAMHNRQRAGYKVPKHLEPSQYFGDDVIKKSVVLKWEAELKESLAAWAQDEKSPFHAVVKDLSPLLFKRSNEEVSMKEDVDKARSRSNVLHDSISSNSNTSSKTGIEGNIVEMDDSDDDEDEDNGNDHITKTTLPLLEKLHKQNALPAILFSYDRTLCEQICEEVNNSLVKAEKIWRANSSVWQTKLKKWKEYQEQQKLAQKEGAKRSKKGKGKVQDTDGYKEDEPLEDINPYHSFNPENPDERFSFAGKVNWDIDDDLQILRDAQVPTLFICAIERGIGVHHAGLPRKLREWYVTPVMLTNVWYKY